MFGKLKNMFGAKDAAVMILAPVEGEVVPVTQVSDPTFGEEILGKGVGDQAGARPRRCTGERRDFPDV